MSRQSHEHSFIFNLFGLTKWRIFLYFSIQDMLIEAVASCGINVKPPNTCQCLVIHGIPHGSQERGH